MCLCLVQAEWVTEPGDRQSCEQREMFVKNSPHYALHFNVALFISMLIATDGECHCSTRSSCKQENVIHKHYISSLREHSTSSH